MGNGEGGVQRVSQVCCLGTRELGATQSSLTKPGMWDRSHCAHAYSQLVLILGPLHMAAPGKAVPGGLSPLLLQMSGSLRSLWAEFGVCGESLCFNPDTFVIGESLATLPPLRASLSSSCSPSTSSFLSQAARIHPPSGS